MNFFVLKKILCRRIQIFYIRSIQYDVMCEEKSDDTARMAEDGDVEGVEKRYWGKEGRR